MATLDQLNPQYQAQYDALLPQLELSVRQANQARGMFYSGQATDAETKAKADLLAKLAAQQATDTQQQTLQANTIAADKAAQEAQTKAAARSTNMGLIGSGLGTAMTLGGLYKMNRGGGNGFQNIFAGGPTGYMQLKDGVMTPVPIGGTSAPSAPQTGLTIDPLAGTPALPSEAPSAIPGFNTTAPNGGFNMTAAASAGVPPVTPPVASMWSNPAGQLGAGLAGGVGGYLAANQLNAGGKNTATWAGLGGLAGMGLGSYFAGTGSPWAAGLGSLAGSLGGGLLSNLFK